MARADLPAEDIVAILSETPGRLTGLNTGLTPEQLGTAPNEGAWPPNYVLAHLRACHDMLGGAMLRIVREDRPEWKGLNPRAWIKKTDYPDWEFGDALHVFLEQREELLGVLEPLPPEGWQRTGLVTDMVGKKFERTVLWYGTWMASHERAHWKQLSELGASLSAGRQ